MSRKLLSTVVFIVFCSLLVGSGFAQVCPGLKGSDSLGTAGTVENTVAGVTYSDSGSLMNIIGISTSTGGLQYYELVVNGSDISTVTNMALTTIQNSLSSIGYEPHVAKIAQSAGSSVTCFGGNSFTAASSGYSYGFVNCYDASLSQLFAVTVAPTVQNDCSVTDIAVKSNGQVVAVGYSFGKLPGVASAPSSSSAFLILFTAAGGVSKTVQLATASTRATKVLCVDSTGVCFMIWNAGANQKYMSSITVSSGVVNWSVSFISGVTTSPTDGALVWNGKSLIAAFIDQNGSQDQIKVIQFAADTGAMSAFGQTYTLGLSSTDNQIVSVQTDSSGNIYICGTALYNFNTQSEIVSTLAFVIALKSNGVLIYYISLVPTGSSALTQAAALIVRDPSSFLLFGESNGAIQGHSVGSQLDVFVANYEPNVYLSGLACNSYCTCNSTEYECDSGPGGTGKCICPLGYSGDNCEIPPATGGSSSGSQYTPGQSKLLLPWWLILLIVLAIVVILALIAGYIIQRDRAERHEREREKNLYGEQVDLTEAADQMFATVAMAAIQQPPPPDEQIVQPPADSEAPPASYDDLQKSAVPHDDEIGEPSGDEGDAAGAAVASASASGTVVSEKKKKKKRAEGEKKKKKKPKANSQSRMLDDHDGQEKNSASVSDSD